jgi:prepilin-type processing-associated H-X9-DG protein
MDAKFDLSGGLAPEDDLPFPEAPAAPDVRESVSIWLYEENGAFGFPRMGIEAVGPVWSHRGIQANFAFADGRVLQGRSEGEAPPVWGSDGRPSVIGGGPLTFRCLEPFRRWSAVFDGPVGDLTVADQIAGVDSGRRIPARLEVEMTMVTPPWIAGALQQKAAEQMNQLEGLFVGGFRFEHLFRAQGVFTVDGVERPFTGTGLRIHRRGVRQMDGFLGHCWQSAVFPSGRAFGYTCYPPRADGSESYNEGYLFQDGRMIPARVTKAPWMTQMVGSGENVTVELESELGVTVIVGHSALSTFMWGHPGHGGLTFQQAGALYAWNGETSYGMLERSSALPR